MVWVTRLLNNQSLVLANRVAPVVNCLILSAYAASGKRLSIVLGGSEPAEQKAIISTALKYRLSTEERWRSFLFGGG